MYICYKHPSSMLHDSGIIVIVNDILQKNCFTFCQLILLTFLGWYTCTYKAENYLNITKIIITIIISIFHKNTDNIPSECAKLLLSWFKLSNNSKVTQNILCKTLYHILFYHYTTFYDFMMYFGEDIDRNTLAYAYSALLWRPYWKTVVTMVTRRFPKCRPG